jgi:Ser-tRNA(Ala) deacylase AlaX
MAKSYYPPMHTAEHILNQTMLRMFTKERSFSSHLERKKSKLDYHFDRNLTNDEINNIEEQVNKIINQNLDVTESFYNIKEAKEKFNLNKLPNNAGTKIRIVKVGNYDTCPCIGEHVKNTSEIGTFKIVSTSYSDGKLRLRFRLLNS